MNKWLLSTYFLVLAIISCSLRATELPASLQVVLISKILTFEHSTSHKKEVSIFVLGAPKIYQAFNKLKMKGYGDISINQLEIGAKLPEKSFNIIYVGDGDLIDDAVRYAAKNSTLLVAPNTNWVKKGITVAIGTKDGRPHFYLNLATSTASGLKWDDKILKVAELY
ncbi:YfiR family protein [Pseudoalteromonas denitrificans]|uniref:DUF4154 domain-containing protein n=1 Tax=Pseudoalteromonas denitrificans DSM 6059 TaxID=1123010 RepID=A0A1I1LSF5_9GAMM|nr:YfiR family protein [Pseudoalteromonas denitrificans]SFC75896.1 protein of unknown function [Pseudoalteromonas denitrificans DSM 6059]